jgi:rSAM/selenodomain-associated transferase 1
VKTAAVVFAREPVAGRVKTRLAAEVGDATAALVYEALLEHALAGVAGSGLEPVLSLAEPPSPGWTALRGRRWEVQRPGSLGSRMAEAFDVRFGEGYDRVIVVGSDVPGLRSDHLVSAERALDAADVVLGPATDGGYWLVAQRRSGADLFSGVPWSSPDTLAATRRRLRTLGVKWVELQELNDLDTEADLSAAIADPLIHPELRRRLRQACRG